MERILLTAFQAGVHMEGLVYQHEDETWKRNLTLEKAHKDVALILQILDEGTLTDRQGRKVVIKVGELLFFEYHLLNGFYQPEYDLSVLLGLS